MNNAEISMTSCPADEVLLDYTAGRLDAAELAAFESHAESCARCGDLRAAQSAVWVNLDAWKPEPVSSGFNRELWRKIDAEAAQPAWNERLLASLGLWKRIAPIAVAAALVVTAFVWNDSPRNGHSPTQKKAAIVVSASDADQLERALDDIQLLHEIDAARPEAGVL